MGQKSPGNSPVAGKHKNPPPNISAMDEFPSLASTGRLTRKELLLKMKQLELEMQLEQFNDNDEDEDEDDEEMETGEDEPKFKSQKQTPT